MERALVLVACVPSWPLPGGSPTQYPGCLRFSEKQQWLHLSPKLSEPMPRRQQATQRASPPGALSNLAIAPELMGTPGNDGLLQRLSTLASVWNSGGRRSVQHLGCFCTAPQFTVLQPASQGTAGCRSCTTQKINITIEKHSYNDS